MASSSVAFPSPEMFPILAQEDTFAKRKWSALRICSKPARRGPARLAQRNHDRPLRIFMLLFRAVDTVIGVKTSQHFLKITFNRRPVERQIVRDVLSRYSTNL